MRGLHRESLCRPRIHCGNIETHHAEIKPLPFLFAPVAAAPRTIDPTVSRPLPPTRKNFYVRTSIFKALKLKQSNLSWILVLAAIFTCSSPASAVEKLPFDRVEPLLKAQPVTYRWLSSALQFPADVTATGEIGSAFKSLAPGKVGPYIFRAKTKGAGTPSEIEVIICTSVEYLDRNGRSLPVAKLESAVQLKEKLQSILVRDPSKGATDEVCGA